MHLIILNAFVLPSQGSFISGTSTEGLQATCAAALELPTLNYEQGLN